MSIMASMEAIMTPSGSVEASMEVETSENPDSSSPTKSSVEGNDACDIQPMSPTQPSSPTTSIPTTLYEQDAAVFGTLNRDLADALAARIQSAITAEVDSLPLLQDGESKEKLRRTLCHKFLRNVDVLEAYSAHHVLTLRNHPPARRKRIVQVLTTGQDLDDIDDPTETGRFEDADNSSTSNFRYPTKEEIPSEEEVADLQDEIEQLQQQLKVARIRRNELLIEAKSLERAESSATEVVNTLEQKEHVDTVNNVQSKVTAAVTSGQTVRELGLEATELMQKLDEVKRNRDNDGTTDPMADPFWDDDLSFTATKLPRLSPEELYLKDRSQLGLLKDTTNLNGNPNTILTDVRDWLKTGKKIRVGSKGDDSSSDQCNNLWNNQ